MAKGTKCKSCKRVKCVCDKNKSITQEQVKEVFDPNKVLKKIKKDEETEQILSENSGDTLTERQLLEEQIASLQAELKLQKQKEREEAELIKKQLQEEAMASYKEEMMAWFSEKGMDEPSQDALKTYGLLRPFKVKKNPCGVKKVKTPSGKVLDPSEMCSAINFGKIDGPSRKVAGKSMIIQRCGARCHQDGLCKRHQTSKYGRIQDDTPSPNILKYKGWIKALTTDEEYGEKNVSWIQNNTSWDVNMCLNEDFSSA